MRLLFAALLACFDIERCDAAERPSFFSARVVARDRLAEVLVVLSAAPFLTSRAARLRVAELAFPAFGGFTFTPDRRAFDSPIAIACLVERAPCLPLRI